MKVLIIRFSSFGDVLQTLSVIGAIDRLDPQAEIHFLTREEFAPLVESHPAVTRVWKLSRSQGFWGLHRLSRQLQQEPWSHVYDAHNNLRSHVVSFYLNGFFGWRRWFWKRHAFVRRSIHRWKRFCLFRLRKNFFELPFSGQRDLLRPLKVWGVSEELPKAPQLFLPEKQNHDVGDILEGRGLRRGDFVALAPSAAHPLKRWPLERWKELIRKIPEEKFAVLGGPKDDFLKELSEESPNRVFNFSGELTLPQSAALIGQSKALIANDTGLLHVAEQMGHPCVALMGPAPFGFPSRSTTRVLERKLWCRPCSKHGQGPCINPEFQKCLRDISVTEVREALFA